MGSVVSHAGGKISSETPLQRHGPDVGLRRFQQWVNATDGKACPNNSSLRIKSPALLRRWPRARAEGREGKSKRRFAAVSKNKDGSLCAGSASRNECGRNFSRRAATELFLHVGLGEPVVVDAKPAAQYPISPSCDIPGEAHARTEQVVDRVQQSVVRSLGVAIRDLLLLGCPCAQVKVSKDCRRTLGPGISAVVIPQTQGDGQSLLRLPGIFRKKSKSPGGCIPAPQLLLPGLRIVVNTVFVRGSVLCQRQQVAERKLRL